MIGFTMRYLHGTIMALRLGFGSLQPKAGYGIFVQKASPIGFKKLMEHTPMCDDSK